MFKAGRQSQRLPIQSFAKTIDPPQFAAELSSNRLLEIVTVLEPHCPIAAPELLAKLVRNEQLSKVAEPAREGSDGEKVNKKTIELTTITD